MRSHDSGPGARGAKNHFTRARLGRIDTARISRTPAKDAVPRTRRTNWIGHEFPLERSVNLIALTTCTHDFIQRRARDATTRRRRDGVACGINFIRQVARLSRATALRTQHSDRHVKSSLTKVERL